MVWVIWAVILVLLYIKYKGGVKCLPEHLQWKVHNDYVFPLLMIPRFLTSYKFRPVPKLLWGYNVNNWTEHEGQKGPDPIQRHLKGKKCSVQLTFPLFFEITIWNGWYFYIGARWDAVDFYYDFIAIDISKAENFVPKDDSFDALAQMDINDF
jgi:hypothetical protein